MRGRWLVPLLVALVGGGLLWLAFGRSPLAFAAAWAVGCATFAVLVADKDPERFR